jgi:NitT/TauT family transport system permease protein
MRQALQRRGRARRGRRVAAAVAPAAVAGLVLVGGWWAATAAFRVSPILVPSPQQVAATFAARPGFLARNGWVTATEAGTGYVLAVAVGLAAGVLLAASRSVARGVWPLLFGFEALPKVALAPLLVVCCGWGREPKVLMVFLLCLLPILFNVVKGLASTPVEALELARSLTATGRQTFLKIRFPYAVPAVFIGLKLAAPLAIVGAVIGELFGATAGLGHTIHTAVTDTPLAGAAMLLLAALSLLLLGAVVAAERLLAPWARHLHH